MVGLSVEYPVAQSVEAFYVRSWTNSRSHIYCHRISLNRVMHPKDCPITVLSTGRAGSTLLQKLLNTHPSLLIWGEHAGILNQLMIAWRVVSRSEWISDNEPRGSWLLQKERPLNSDRWTAWDGSFSKQGFRLRMKRFIDSLFCDDIPAHIRWGFKEIRYHQIELMDFWSELYPQAQYILLVRNPIDSSVSFAAARTPKGGATRDDICITMNNIVNKQIKPVFSFFREAMERYSNNAHPVLFEKLVEEPERTLEGIGSFLGLDSEFDTDAVSMIMAKDIVSQRKNTSQGQKDMLRSMALPLLKEELEWFESFSGEFAQQDSP